MDTVISRPAPRTDGDPQMQAFLDAMTKLSLSYGIGITGAPVLFVMESDDYERRYRSDSESALEFI